MNIETVLNHLKEVNSLAVGSINILKGIKRTNEDASEGKAKDKPVTLYGSVITNMQLENEALKKENKELKSKLDNEVKRADYWRDQYRVINGTDPKPITNYPWNEEIARLHKECHEYYQEVQKWKEECKRQQETIDSFHGLIKRQVGPWPTYGQVQQEIKTQGLNEIFNGAKIPENDERVVSERGTIWDQDRANKEARLKELEKFIVVHFDEGLVIPDELIEERNILSKQLKERKRSAKGPEVVWKLGFYRDGKMVSPEEYPKLEDKLAALGSEIVKKFNSREYITTDVIAEYNDLIECDKREEIDGEIDSSLDTTFP